MCGDLDTAKMRCILIAFSLISWTAGSQHVPSRPTKHTSWAASYRPVPSTPASHHISWSPAHKYRPWITAQHHASLTPRPYSGPLGVVSNHESWTAANHRGQWAISNQSRNTNFMDNNLRGNPLMQQNIAPKSRKVSLVFVIDSTGSMYREIQQVKDGIKTIFKTLLEHPESSIHDFVLVPFNDPLVGPILVTTNPQRFIKLIENIRVDGGGDCDEKSLKGLQVAITRSLPGSYVFVFTDAGAKDYNLLPELETLIQQKQSQVVFVLTGDCGGQNNPGYQAYERIAAMSFGQVFNLWKDEVQKVLAFVNYTIYERNKVNIITEDIPGPGRENYSVPVDTHTNSLTVSLSGKDPIIHMKNPNGKEIQGKPILNVHTGLVVNVVKPSQGNWSVNVGSTSNHHVRVSGSSQFSFAYGFSNFFTHLLETASLQPETGIPTSLLVKVTNQSQLHNLTTVKLKDYNQQVIKKLDLYPVEGQPGLYKTIMFMTPNKQFFIEVIGVDSNGFLLERISQTAIIPKIAVGRHPVVYALSNVKLHPGLKQEIWCSIESKTNYSVRWNKMSKYGKYLPVTGPRFSTRTTGNLVISPVTLKDEGWYRCIAENEGGRTEKQVHVEVSGKLEVKVTPKKVYFMDGETITLSCKAEGEKDLVLEWRKNGKVVESLDLRLKIQRTETNSLNLHLMNIQESDEGHYQCIARSNGSQAVGAAEVVHVQYPTINRTTPDNVLSEENAEVILHCSIQGKPKPTITWLKNGRKIKPDQNFKVLPGGDLLIPTVKTSTAGAFTCIGKNSLGQAQQTVNLEVGTPPEFITEPQNIDIPINSSGSILCDVEGSPKPEIIWQRVDEKEIDQTRIITGRSCTLIISDARYEDRGTYTVTAQNSFGVVKISVTVTISGIVPPRLENTYQETKISAGDTAILPCYATGSPPPDFQWLANGSPVIGHRENIMVLQNAHQDVAGTYKCQASNVAGKVEKVFHVTVVDNKEVKN